MSYRDGSARGSELTSEVMKSWVKTALAVSSIAWLDLAVASREIQQQSETTP